MFIVLCSWRWRRRRQWRRRIVVANYYYQFYSSPYAVALKVILILLSAEKATMSLALPNCTHSLFADTSKYPRIDESTALRNHWGIMSHLICPTVLFDNNGMVPPHARIFMHIVVAIPIEMWKQCRILHAILRNNMLIYLRDKVWVECVCVLCVRAEWMIVTVRCTL